MHLRLFILLCIAGLACTGAVAVTAGAHGKRAAAIPRIPALPKQNESVVGRCPIPARFRPAFVLAARDTGFQLSMLVAVAHIESRFQTNARSTPAPRALLPLF